MTPSDRARLPGRREFFRLLTGEAEAFTEEVRGIPQFRLEELPELPDAKLKQLVPLVLPQARLAYSENQVILVRGENLAPLPLFPAASEQMRIFCRFDGKQSLATISRALLGPAHRPGEEESTYRQVKALFLQLVGVGVCVPANPAS